MWETVYDKLRFIRFENISDCLSSPSLSLLTKIRLFLEEIEIER